MRRLIVPLFLITSALSLADQGGFGGPIHLTGLNGFPTNSAGAWHTGWYNTFGSPSDPGKNAYVIAGSSVLGNFLNSGNATPTMIDVDISAPGRYQFCALFEGNEIYAGRDFWGLNLFFNGQNVLPKISAYSAPNTGAALSPPTFSGR